MKDSVHVLKLSRLHCWPVFVQVLHVMLLFVMTSLVCASAWAGSDSVAGATVINSIPFSEIVDNTNFTSDEPDDVCDIAGSFWYTYTPTVDETVILSVNGKDTALAIYAVDSPPDASSDSECQDFDTYHDLFNVKGGGEMTYAELSNGTTYLIVAGSADSKVKGLIQVQLRADDAAQIPADDLADAQDVNTLPFFELVDNTDFSNEPSEVICDDGKNSFWYQITPEFKGVLIVRASSSDTEISVFTGTDHPLTVIYEDYCDNDNLGAGYSEIYPVSVQAGVTYYIQIGDNQVADEGLHAISIDIFKKPEPDPDVVPPIANFEFQDDFKSSIMDVNDLIQTGDGVFSDADVNGQQCRVYAFSVDSDIEENNGLSLDVTGLFSGEAYTFVAMIKLSDVDSWARLLRTNGDSEIGTSEYGLYVHSSEIEFYNYDSSDYIPPYIPRVLTPDTWVQVALTYDGTALISGYIDGVAVFTIDDSAENFARISHDTFYFFSDDSDENAPGSVANIRLYDQALTAAQVAGLTFLCNANAPSPPAPPTQVDASDGTHIGKVLISWSSVSDATSYNVYSSASLESTRSFLGSTTTTTFEATGGEPGVAAYFWVFSVNAIGESATGTYDTGYPRYVAPPTVVTTAASGIGQTSATLNGTANPNEFSTSAWFELGTSTSYGHTTSSVNVGSGSSPVAYNRSVSSLICNKMYHFRAVAQNAYGTSYGSDRSFTTSACPIEYFSIGGNVSGLTGSGLVLQNNGGDNLAITANGGFTFSTEIADDSGYAVTVKTQPTGPEQICSVSGGSGIVSGAAVTNVQVTCTLTTSCNANVVSGVTETSEAVHEACANLIVGPDVTMEDGSSVILSSGLSIDLMPGVLVGSGATLNVKVCGQSLCNTSSLPMPYGCHSCVDKICDIDSACCSTRWSQSCLNKVSTVCGLVCE